MLESRNARALLTLSLVMFGALYYSLHPTVESGPGVPLVTHAPPRAAEPRVTPVPWPTMKVSNHLTLLPLLPTDVVKVDTRTDCEQVATDSNVSSRIPSIRLCYDKSLCRGSMVVVVKDCEAQKGRALSKNSTFSDEIKRRHGADLFKFRMEGEAGVVTAVPRYTGQKCTYIIPIRVPPALVSEGSTRTEYLVGLEWLYADYHALDEVTNHWPPLRKQSLLPTLPNFFTQYHLQQCTVPSTLSLSCERREPIVPPFPSDLKACDGFVTDSSGYWKTDIPRDFVHTRVRVRKIQRQPIVFEWAIQRDLARHWVPEHCASERFNSDDARTLLKGKSILIGGDSQSRAMYYSVANFVSGFGSECLRNISTVAAEPSHCVENVKGSQRKKLGSLDRLDFTDDHFLDKVMQGRYNGYDIVVIGFAQHPASKEHWSFDKYKSALQARAPHISKLKSAGTLVVWMTAPQYPHTKKGYPVVVKDWRTDARLELFNNYSTEVMGSLGIPVLDTYTISAAMSHTSPDQAHFTNFVAYEFVQYFLNIVKAHLNSKR